MNALVSEEGDLVLNSEWNLTSTFTTLSIESIFSSAQCYSETDKINICIGSCDGCILMQSKTYRVCIW